LTHHRTITITKTYSPGGHIKKKKEKRTGRLIPSRPASTNLTSPTKNPAKKEELSPPERLELSTS
jgi:hypothetical protein